VGQSGELVRVVFVGMLGVNQFTSTELYDRSRQGCCVIPYATKVHFNSAKILVIERNMLESVRAQCAVKQGV